MVWLVLGVFMWSVVHLFPSVLPAKRMELMARYGKVYEGIFALKILIALALIIIGWRLALPTQLYTPPVWGRHATMLLVLIAVILFAAAQGKSRLRQYVLHPMLEGVAIWSVGHLLANGDSRSVVLFGGLLVWSLLNQFTINRRDGVWVKPEVGSIGREVVVIVVSLVVYLALMFLHPYFTGRPLMA